MTLNESIEIEIRPQVDGGPTRWPSPDSWGLYQPDPLSQRLYNIWAQQTRLIEDHYQFHTSPPDYESSEWFEIRNLVEAFGTADRAWPQLSHQDMIALLISLSQLQIRLGLPGFRFEISHAGWMSTV